MRTLLFLLLGSLAAADVIIVRDGVFLRTALRGLKPDTTLKIAPGDYPGGHHVSGVEKLTVAALDPQNPPHFRGGAMSAAFVGVEGAEFTNNTVLFPEKWIFRILQETKGTGFRPCSYVLIKGNKVTFRRSQVQIDINIGDGTAPETFRFENNRWFAEDKPQASKPRLPVAEKDAVDGVDPR
ncbi:MAG: hypothetical protein QE570_20500 [Verrucomicrobiota bacterium]|nr:hypothetical protein [Verrucomicrobiota bacterium]